jgi:hypothetical protein
LKDGIVCDALTNLKNSKKNQEQFFISKSFNRLSPFMNDNGRNCLTVYWAMLHPETLQMQHGFNYTGASLLQVRPKGSEIFTKGQVQWTNSTEIRNEIALQTCC